MQDVDIESYLIRMDQVLSNEPIWVPPSVTKAMSVILEMEKTGIYHLSQDTQGTLNRFIHRKVVNYTPKMVQIILPGNDVYIFDEARLFPIHTLEWCIATLELLVEHFYEFSWISEKAFSKIARVMIDKYGSDLAYEFVENAESWIPLKSCDWNRIMYETLDTILPFMKEYGRNELREVEMFISDLISSASEHMWSSKDRVDLIDHFNYADKLSDRTKPGVVMFNIISNINVKTKKKK